MKFTDLFIKRPVLAIVMSALLLLLGIQSASELQIRQFPEIEKGLITGTQKTVGEVVRMPSRN